jgi:hypothetical protein
MKNIHDYSDIINLPHYTSSKRAKMSLEDRAAQFAPFEALTGHEELIEETGRKTDCKIELSETVIEELNRKIQFIKDNLKEKKECVITYFVEDKHKNGGAYIVKKGIVRKIDSIGKEIVMEDKTSIPVNDVIEIESPLFENLK